MPRCPKYKFPKKNSNNGHCRMNQRRHMCQRRPLERGWAVVDDTVDDADDDNGNEDNEGDEGMADSWDGGNEGDEGMVEPSDDGDEGNKGE